MVVIPYDIQTENNVPTKLEKPQVASCVGEGAPLTIKYCLHALFLLTKQRCRKETMMSCVQVILWHV